jgi:glycosyltransferase involved in cell wall biosynthesis
VNVLFITAHVYLPQMRGGLQSSTDELCRSLVARGHRVAVLAGLASRSLTLKSRIKMQINSRLFGCKVTRETGLGYPVWYSWLPWEAVKHVARKEKPDLIVVMAVRPVRMALAAKPTGIPILIQLQDVQFNQHDGPFQDLGKIACVANSNFTAEKYRRAYGVNPSVIYPFILKEKYKTLTPPTRENVTFINPVPVKGSDLALRIALLCPEIPFSFVEAWPLSDDQRRELRQRLSAVPNVTLFPPQEAMRKVYGKCKILLAPSVWEEAYGRVATEAQINGIPVVASARGGLPEAVGPGGILLNPDGPLDRWAAAIRKLWHDQRHYAQLSAAALTYATRPETSFDYQIDAWERAMLAATNVLQSFPA